MEARHRLPALALGAACALLIGACGSSNNAATVATTTTTPPATTTTTVTTIPVKKPKPATPAQTTSTPAPQTTRTATAPAFVQPRTPGQLAAAEAVLARSGYSAADTASFAPAQTLQVLVGQRGDGASRRQQAFFFVGGRYIGTDASSPSAKISVVAQNDTAVTLRYGLYRDGDSTPSGSASVQFVLNNGRLAPLGTIPPVSGPNGGRR